MSTIPPNVLISRSTLQIMANFDLYRDVALMYLDVDKQVIIPGSTLVKKLNMSNMSTLSDEEFFKDNKKKLKDWCDKAQTTVHDVVKTVSRPLIYSHLLCHEDILSCLAETNCNSEWTSKAHRRTRTIYRRVSGRIQGSASDRSFEGGRQACASHNGAEGCNSNRCSGHCRTNG